MSGPGQPVSADLEPRRLVFVALLVAVLVSMAIQGHNLANEPVELWDESFHAVVARNLLKHPLKPTLIDVPYLPYDYRNWHENHVWMHKPILPLWQIAASFAVFGVNRFALRLPSYLLSAGCILLTYAIGRRLVGRWAGVVAACVQALSPAILQLVHGQWFADHVDVSLLFWTEVGVLFLLEAVESGRWRDVAVCGVATGFAYLSKSYLAAIVPGLAVVAWLLTRRPAEAGPGSPTFAKRGWGGGGPSTRFRLRHAAGVLGVALLTIAPWTIYAFVNYRNEFLFEYAAWWHHLAGEWEDWGAPWQRVVFDYLPNLHQLFYAPVVFAAIALLVPAIRERSFGLLFLFAWVAGVFLPHFIAPTKTPTATLIAVPPLVMLFGALVSRALRGDPWSLVSWAAIAVVSVVHPAKIRPPNRGYALDPGLSSIAAKAPWLLWNLGAAVLGALLAFAGMKIVEQSLRESRPVRGLRVFLVAAAGAGTLWLLAQTAWTGWKTADRVDRTKPDGIATDEIELGDFARTELPKNAVLLFEGDRYVTPVMFHADRTCYALRERDLEASAAAVRSARGRPYFVVLDQSPRRPPGKKPLFTHRDGYAIFEMD